MIHRAQTKYQPPAVKTGTHCLDSNWIIPFCFINIKFLPYNPDDNMKFWHLFLILHSVENHHYCNLVLEWYFKCSEKSKLRSTTECKLRMKLIFSFFQSFTLPVLPRDALASHPGNFFTDIQKIILILRTSEQLSYCGFFKQSYLNLAFFLPPIKKTKKKKKKPQQLRT